MNAVPSLLPFQFFDHTGDVLVVERRLPHWSQPGTLTFITWRTCDSMPKAVLDVWQVDRINWLKAHGINSDTTWEQALRDTSPNLVQEFRERFWTRWHDELDKGHGACVLRNPALSQIVANSLQHFEGDRYSLLDYVIMPNHVHLLAVFPDERSMLAQCESWKHFTATQINRRLNQHGRFWQQDSFDHLVRSEKQFNYLRDYIADNPKKARLAEGGYVHFSKLNLNGESQPEPLNREGN